MSGTLLSLGHGYCAQALARHLLARGWRVVGTTRDPVRAEHFRRDGVEPLLWPQHSLLPWLQQASHVLVSMPPAEEGDPILARHRDELLAASVSWLGYLSATSVYGDHAGAWVDENTATTPTTARGRTRLAAEQAWQALPLPVHVFRLAGLYGPGRNALVSLRTGQARHIVRPGLVFSRVHVDDVAQVLLASMQRPQPGAVYNVADDEPAAPDQVVLHAADLLGLPPPPAEAWETAAMTPMLRSFYSESKRVGNARLRDVLGVTLRYPSYREGLAALLEGEAETEHQRES